MSWLRPIRFPPTRCVAVAPPILPRTVRSTSRVITTFPRNSYRREQPQCFTSGTTQWGSSNRKWHNARSSTFSSALEKNAIPEDTLHWKTPTHSYREKANSADPKDQTNEHISPKDELSNLLSAERQHNDRLSQTTQALQDQIKYLSTRLKQEAHLRSQYSEKESRILAHARYTQLLRAAAEKLLRSAPRKVLDWVKMLVVVIVAFPFVISLAAAPVWVAIMLYAWLDPQTTPSAELEGVEEADLSVVVGGENGFGRDGMGDEAVAYNHGVIDLLGWVIVAGVLAAPLLLQTSSL